MRGASQNTSAGVYTEGSQEYVLEAIGRVRSAEEIGDTVVALRGDRSVLVRDVADVREGAAFKRGEGSRSGKPAVIVGVQKQPGANTIELTARLDRELDALQQELPRGITIDRRIFRQADFIEVAVDNVIEALRDGGILVVIVVLLFLANLRAAAITLTAIPLSLAAAVLVLRAFGASINTMTLGGMAIAIGALVDDAIIDVENVVRRLRENQARPPEAAPVCRDDRARRHARDPLVDRVRDPHHRPGVPAGVRPVRRRRTAADAAGVRLHRRAARLARGRDRGDAGAVLRLPAERARRSSAATTAGCARVLKARFARDLPRMLDRPAHRHRRLRCCCSWWRRSALTRAGTSFLPEFHEGSLTVQANTLPGTSLAKSDEIGRRVEQILLSQPEVVATARRTGRAEYDEHVQGVEAAEIDVGLRETDRPRDELLAELRRQFSTLPGTNVTIGQPISHRIDHMLSGTRANIAVKVFGDDLGTLRRLGERVRAGDGDACPGVVDLSLEQQMDVPFVRFVLNRPAIARYGLRPGDVAEAIETSFAGATVGRIFDRGTAFDLVVKLDAVEPRGLRSHRRSADRHAGRRDRAGPHARRRAARGGAEHGAARERAAPDRHLVQRRRTRSRQRRRRHPATRWPSAVPMPAGYRVEYGGQFESEAERVAAAARARACSSWPACSCCSCWPSAARATR